MQAIAQSPVIAAAALVRAESEERAAEALARVSPSKVGEVLDELPSEVVADLVRRMDPEALKERLPEMSPEKLHQVSAQLLWEQLPDVPAVQLAPEEPPVVDPTLPAPSAQSVSPTRTVYAVPETAEGRWVTVVGSPAPLEKVVAKFTRKLSEVRLSVVDLEEVPSIVPTIGASRVVSDVFRLDLENAPLDSISVAYITFFVSSDWIDSNQVHKWSIQLDRFDEHTNSWVAYPARRSHDDDGRIYYTVAVSGFSLFAITGSAQVAPPLFQVRDLTISPASVAAGQDVTITARVTNVGPSRALYPANLWLNDTIEDSQTIVLEGGETATIKFTLHALPGSYKVRIDRLLAQLTVVESPPTQALAALPVTTTPGPTPSPTPQPKGSFCATTVGVSSSVDGFWALTALMLPAWTLWKRRRWTRPNNNNRKNITASYTTSV